MMIPTTTQNGNSNGRWRRTTHAETCPVCAHGGWCSISDDGTVAACRRIDAGAWRSLTDPSGAPVYLHRLTGDQVRPPTTDIRTPGASAKCADATTTHSVLDAMLAALVLSAAHRDALHTRGLADEDIDHRLYRSLPVQGRAQIAGDLAERFGAETLLSVPGFVKKNGKSSKYITIAGSAGLLIPCRDIEGRIVAVKVRRDQNGPGKYTYLSSRKYGGPGPGAPCHIPCGIVAPVDVVRVTEGELKADIAYALSGIPTLSVPGVASWKTCLPALRTLATTTVYIAFDGDAADNPVVARALADCYGGLSGDGFAVAVERWHTTHKGIDDALAAGETLEQLDGDAARAYIEDVVLSATAGEPLPPPSPLDHLAETLSDGAEAFFRDAELLDALAALAESEPGEYACRRAKVKANGVSLRDLDRAIAPLRQQVRAAKPPRTSAGQYRVSGGVIVRTIQTKDGPPVDVPLANFSATIVAETTVDDGAERSIRLEIEGTHADGSPLPRCEVAADRYAWMEWIVPAWGTRAVVSAGASTKDHLRAAIQLMSGDVVTRTVYGHLGWRQVGGRWTYLHAGGAIGADGVVDGVEVSPPGDLERYQLPTPPDGDDLRDAVRASLGLLDLGPARLMYPLLAGVYRAVLGPADFALHLTGQSGVYKSEVAALHQQHYGPGMDRPHLPASWASTANSLEGIAFATKDAILTVDDFAPSGSANDVSRLHREAERLLRAQGNSAGRGRMRRDGTLAPAKPPRGLILSTGEDIPRGQSLRARLLILECGRGDFVADRLTQCQRDAAAGVYAASLAGFVRWLAPQYEAIRDGLAADRARLRDGLASDGQHARTPTLVADLALGLRYLLDYAAAVGAIDQPDRDELARRGWSALREAAAKQEDHQRAADPVEMFMRLMSSAISSGRAHVASMSGDRPESAAAWGWRREDTRTGPEWRAQGRRVGWVDEESLYIDADSAYATAQGLADEQAESLSVTQRILWARMKERGLLLAVDTRGRRVRFTVRRQIAGKMIGVLFLRASSLTISDCGQCGQCGQCGDIQRENDTFSVATMEPVATSVVASAPIVATENDETTAENQENGHTGHTGHKSEQGSTTPQKINATSNNGAWVAHDADPVGINGNPFIDSENGNAHSHFAPGRPAPRHRRGRT